MFMRAVCGRAIAGRSYELPFVLWAKTKKEKINSEFIRKVFSFFILSYNVCFFAGVIMPPH